ncbi:MAG: histidine kinase [Ferruginibacter sp.]
MKIKNHLLLFWLLFFPLAATAQHKEYNLQNFTQEDGLPSNESYFVYRDSRHFLWFATDNGVVRFNGSRMDRFTLPDNVVFKIREDHKGRIWFFTRTGRLSYFQNEKIHPYAYNDSIQKYCLPLLIGDAYVDDQDNIHINSLRFYNYLIQSDGRVIKQLYAPWINTEHPLRPAANRMRIIESGDNKLFSVLLFLSMTPSDSIFISLDKNGKPFTYAISGITKQIFGHGAVSFDGHTVYAFIGKSLLKLSPDGSYQIKNYNSLINSISKGPNQTLWVGFMKAGAEQLDTAFNRLLPQPLLSDKSVTSICYDNEGGCWFSTLENGIYYLKTQQVTHIFTDTLAGTNVFRLCYDLDSNLLLGAKKGIFRLSGNGIRPVYRKNFLQLHDMLVTPSGNIMLAASPERTQFNLGDIIPIKNDPCKYVYCLPVPNEIIPFNDTQFLVVNYEAIAYYNTRTVNGKKDFFPVYFNKMIREPGPFYMDQRHRIWLGTIRNLYYFDDPRKAGKVFMPGSIFQNGISCIRQFSNGIYCFGIRFNGIVLMKDSTLLTTISEKNGLLSNAVKYLLPMGNDLWAATTNGVSVIRFQSFSPVRYTIVNIGKNLGLYNMIISQLLPYKGSMLVASSNGLFEISHPEELLARDPQPIPFYINSVNFYKGDTSNISSISLPANKNRILIRLSAICYNLPGELRYYYRFSNKDTSWNTTASPDLLLENMSPGKYVIEMRAAIPGLNRFSAVKVFTLTIEKYWWQHTWLLVLAGLLLALIIILFLRYRIKTITRRARQATALNRKMMELEQTALRSQMNPHFIFNCLTSIQQLVLTGNKAEANEYLVKFARLIRKTMEFSTHSFISVEEEINYLKEYIVLEQLRMPGAFSFTVTADPAINAAATEIPSMMIQPLIENSIRHGIKHLQNRKGVITLELIQEENFIVCRVTDNGTGRDYARRLHQYNPYSQHKSYGIDIIQKRLEILAGPLYEPGLFTITDRNPDAGDTTGTCCTLYLPFKKNRK